MTEILTKKIGHENGQNSDQNDDFSLKIDLNMLPVTHLIIPFQ